MAGNKVYVVFWIVNKRIPSFTALPDFTDMQSIFFAKFIPKWHSESFVNKNEKICATLPNCVKCIEQKL